MNIKAQNFIQYQRAIMIIFIAMLIGQIVFAGITTYLVITMGSFAIQDGLRDIFLIIVPVMFLGQMVASKIVVSMKLKSAKAKGTLMEKMIDYRGICIVKYAMLEGVAFFSIISLLLTADYVFLVFIGLIVVLFYTYQPTKEKLIADLELKKDEISILEDEKAIVCDGSLGV